MTVAGSAGLGEAAGFGELDGFGAGAASFFLAAGGGLGFRFSGTASGVATGGVIWSCAAAGAVSSSVARMVIRGSFMSGASRAPDPQAQSHGPS